MNAQVNELPSRSPSSRRDTRASMAGLLPCLFAALVVFPSLVWIAVDTSAWGGDQSQYALASVELFRTLTTSPQEWPRRMLDIFPYKPNGLIWLGQAFVPIGYLISSIDTALLLLVIVLQVVTLILVYHSVRALSSSAFVVPATACLVIASAPIFIQFAHYYLVETYQAVSVAWFILIVSLAPTWSCALLMVQLTAATAFAMSAKEIQPLFCVWPGLVACFYLLRPKRPVAATASGRVLWVSFALAVPLTAVTLAWYVWNLASVTQHLYDGTYGPGVRALWGKEDTYLNTVVFWLQTARTINFLPGLAELSLLIVTAGVIAYALRANKASGRHFALCAAIAALQIVTAILVFSLSPTRQPRYLLPALPYVAVLLAWSMAQLNHRIAKTLVIGIFVVQLVLLQGQALNVLPIVGRWVGPVNWNARSGRVLDSIVAETCSPTGSGVQWNVLAVEPSIPELGGDWLAPEPANYVVAKQRLRNGGELPCQFGWLGDSFFGSDVATAWERILSRQAKYVVVVDPAVYTTPAQVFNQALSRDNFPVVLQKLQTSDLFEREPRLAEDPGVLIFRRVSPADR